jgi:Xaa-Pro aminopeptidase
MQDFQDRLTITLSGKTHLAMLAFLKKHGADSHDVSRFIEDAITWRIIDREMAFRNAKDDEEIALFRNHGESDERLSA